MFLKNHHFFLFIFLFFTLINNVSAQKNVTFNVFTNEGLLTSYEEMLTSVSKSDIVYFGELHNSSLAHWLEQEIQQDLALLMDNKIICGAEMFESDNQLILDEYLSDFFGEKKFIADCRLWENYETDYRPLVEFAKANKIELIATNIPRRYASMVFKKGVHALDILLDDKAKSLIAPLPFPFDTIPSYKSLIGMMSSHSGGVTFAQAQAIKDATMAHFIVTNMKEDYLFLHFNGSFHSENNEGIYWQVEQLTDKYKQNTIIVIEQDNVAQLEETNLNKGDFIIVIPSNFTKTY